MSLSVSTVCPRCGARRRELLCAVAVLVTAMCALAGMRLGQPGCVLVGGMWAASSASAASRQWTVQNLTTAPLLFVSATPFEDHRIDFEGRPKDLSPLLPGKTWC
jgi:hypothetical protein